MTTTNNGDLNPFQAMAVRAEEAHSAFMGYLQKLQKRGVKHLRVATHNGRFHADEIMAYAIFKYFIKNVLPAQYNMTFELKIKRHDRSDKALERAHILLDIGQEYDPARGRFDHHQAGGAGGRVRSSSANNPQGVDIPFSTCGLIWFACGRFITDEMDESCYRDGIASNVPRFFRIDSRLVRSIDASDNGLTMPRGYTYNSDEGSVEIDGAPLHASVCIGQFNRDTSDELRQLTQFNQALSMADMMFANMVELTTAWSQDQAKVQAVLKHKRKNRAILVFKDAVSWQEHIFRAPEAAPVRIVISRYGPSSSTWCATTVNVKSRRVKPLYFPKSWCGLNGKELCKVAGIEGLVFCHAQGFTLRAKTFDAALAAAEKALSYARGEIS